MNFEHSMLIVMTCALITIMTRALPFAVFGGKKEIPAFVRYLGSVLPYAIMAALVVYCLKNINIMTGNHALPEILAVLLVVLVHLWKKNTLFSIGLGTAFYMFLIQVIFV